VHGGGARLPRALTEVWLDLTISRRGACLAVTSVPLRVAAGERSVVLHDTPTDATGAAGTRLARLPVVGPGHLGGGAGAYNR